MRVASGKVVAGKIVVDGLALEEGSTVTVIAPEQDEVFDLSPADEEALLVAITEADQGDLLAADDVLAQICRDR